MARVSFSYETTTPSLCAITYVSVFRKLLNSSRVNPASRSKRHQRSLRHVAIVRRYHGAATGNRIVENAVAARGVSQLAVRLN